MSARTSALVGARPRVRLIGLAWIGLGLLIGVAIFVWLAANGSAAQSSWLPNPRAAASATAGPGLVERSDNRGQVLFGRFCDSCHPGGREGVGSDLEGTQVKRQYTTDEKIVSFVRAGGFDMPAFPRSLISDDDLAEIAAYVHALPPAQQTR
jgi:mono/diheme cytochrome c family protein